MKRTVQNLLFDIRKCEKEIQEIKRQKKELEDALQLAQKDLVQEKKIRWVEKSFEEWYVGEEEEFHIYSNDCGISYGVWEGLDDLSKEDREHFDEFVRDYHYYAAPKYVELGTASTECELAFEGDTSLKIIYRDKL